EIADNDKPLCSIVDRLNLFERRRDGDACSGRLQVDPGEVAGDDRVRDVDVGEGGRDQVRDQVEPVSVGGVAGEPAEHAVLDVQDAAGIEGDAVPAACTGADDGQPAQVDDIRRAGVDRDPVARGHGDPGLDPLLVDDADCLGDRHRAVAGGVEDGDLAARIGL